MTLRQPDRDEVTRLNGTGQREYLPGGEALWVTFESEAMPHAASLFRLALWAVVTIQPRKLLVVS
jgi:hypothetical protein